MFIGHFAVGFAAKRWVPATNLAVLIAAPVFVDMLWPAFLLLGWERVRIDPGNTRFTPLDFTDYPWSHSLLMTGIWAAAFALVYYSIRQYRAGAVALGFGVISHWVLDWVTHRPDMPLYPGGPRYGLGLWNSIPGTLVVELALFAVGLGLYVGTTRARDRIGRYAFLAYAAFLLLIYIGDRFSEPPSSVSEIAWPGLIAVVVFIPWAWWFDRHRTLRTRELPVAAPLSQ